MLITSGVYGRLGNNVYQLLGLIYMSERLNEKINFISHRNTILYKMLDVNELMKSINKNKENKKKIKHHFFKLYQLDSSFNPKREYFNIGKKIIPFLKQKIVPLDDEDLYIHLRSGDVFTTEQKFYTQPPLNYYVKIIKENKYKRYIIITENDNNNPIVRELKKIFPEIIIQRGNTKKDFYTLLSCKNLIPTRSSFSITAIYLNPYLKNIYFIDDLINKDNHYDLLSISEEECDKRINYHNYKLIEKYIKVGDWCQQERNKILLEYPENKIIKI